MGHPIVYLTAAAYSLRGSRHLQSGQPCQDQYFLIRETSRCTAVLCDGCSTAALGREAARITSRTVCRLLHQQFNRCLYADPLAVRQQFADAVEAALRKKAAQCGADPRQLACTLAAASLDQRGRLVCLHLGDGGILRAGPDSTLLRVSAPETGLLPDHELCFIPPPAPVPAGPRGHTERLSLHRRRSESPSTGPAAV